MRAQHQYSGLEPRLSSQYFGFSKHHSCKSQSNKCSCHSVSTNLSPSNTQSTKHKVSTGQNGFKEFMPEGLEEILSQERANISKLKKKIQKQKGHIDVCFRDLSTQIEHVLRDFKLSVFAKMDFEYHQILAKYAALKNQLQSLQMHRKLSKMESVPSFPTPISDNKGLIQELRRAEDEYKSSLVRSRLTAPEPCNNAFLGNLVSDIQRMVGTTQPIADQERIKQRVGQIRNLVCRFIQPLYGDLEQFLSWGRQQQPIIDNSSSFANLASRKQSPIFNQKPIVHNVECIDSFSRHEAKSAKRNNLTVVSPQNLVVQAASSLSLVGNFCVRALHTEVPLCSVGYKGQVITGGKDAIVTVNSTDGEKVTTLRAHTASVCCLAIIRSGKRVFVASGGDLGCGHVIMWATDDWSMFAKIQAHKAAVSGIADAGDGNNIITAGYDKSINIINYMKSQVVYSQICQKPVIGIALNPGKSVLVSCHLSPILNVWDVKRKQGQIMGLQIKTQLQNDQVNCVVLTSAVCQNVVVSGDKGGTIKLWDTRTRKCIQSYKCHECLVIDMIVVDRANKKDFPLIISCGNKDKFLVLTDTETGRMRQILLKNQVNFLFGCGIGPKMFLLGEGPRVQVGLVSQSPQRKEVQICDIELQN